MSCDEKKMWRINIENAASEVCGTYGADVARSVFQDTMRRILTT